MPNGALSLADHPGPVLRIDRVRYGRAGRYGVAGLAERFGGLCPTTKCPGLFRSGGKVARPKGFELQPLREGFSRRRAFAPCGREGPRPLVRNRSQ
jgi:hypothetical protein